LRNFINNICFAIVDFYIYIIINFIDDLSVIFTNFIINSCVNIINCCANFTFQIINGFFVLVNSFFVITDKLTVFHDESIISVNILCVIFNFSS